MFCGYALLASIGYDERTVDFVRSLAKTKHGYAEILDRGFVDFSIESSADVERTASFVQLVQSQCGMVVYCLEEIAWRRGLLDLHAFGPRIIKYRGTKYGDYLQQLLEKWFKCKLPVGFFLVEIHLYSKIA